MYIYIFYGFQAFLIILKLSQIYPMKRNNFRRNRNSNNINRNSNINNRIRARRQFRRRRRRNRQRLTDDTFFNRRRLRDYRRAYERNLQKLRESELDTAKMSKINKNINELTSSMNKLALTNTNIVNKFKSKKEMRDDALISPMNMIKYSNKKTFFRTPMKIIKYEYYQQFNVILQGAAADSLSVFWLPYAYPSFKPGTVIDNNVACDQMSQIFYVHSSNNAFGGFYIKPSDIRGECRLVGASLRLTNTSPVVDKQGSYTIYQLHSPNIMPIVSSSQFPLENANTLPAIFKDPIISLLNSDLNTINTKMTFTSNDIAYIDEYGVHEGSNIFTSTNEYYGSIYTFQIGGINYRVSLPIQDGIQPNPIGPNISYLIKFSNVTTSQTYLLEYWQIWEVAPSVTSSLGNLAQLNTDIFSEKIKRLAENNFPMHK